MKVGSLLRGDDANCALTLYSRRICQGCPRHGACSCNMVVLLGMVFLFTCSWGVASSNEEQHCQLIPDGLEGLESFASTSSTVTIPVEAFTPILGTLLLGTSEKVITPARFAILDMLSRMRRADARETGVGRVPSSSSSQANIAFLSNNLIEDDDESPCPATGLFKMEERGMFRQELLHSVIIGMSRLDMDDEPMDVDEPSPQANTEAKPGSGTSHSNRPSPSSQQENPYFPSLSHSSNSTRSASSTPPASPPTGQKSRNETRTSSFSPVHSPTSPNTSPRPPAPPRRSPPPSPGSEWPEEKPPSRMEQDHRQEFDEAYDHLGSDARKAALGRLSSMSLIAAVTATGPLILSRSNSSMVLISCYI